MKEKRAYPMSFAERFPSPELQNEEVTRNHAAPISKYCSSCGISLGYMHYMENDSETPCPACGAIIEWDREKEV